jgi:hypothetical protein
MKVIARGRVKGGTSVRGLAQHKANSLNNGDEAKPSTYAYVLNIYICINKSIQTSIPNYTDY